MFLKIYIILCVFIQASIAEDAFTIPRVDVTTTRTEDSDILPFIAINTDSETRLSVVIELNSSDNENELIVPIKDPLDDALTSDLAINPFAAMFENSVLSGRVAAVRLVLDLAGPASSSLDLGPALINATAMGEAEVVRLLLDSGANVDFQNALGNFPLLVAVSRDRTEVADLLLERGASLDLQNNVGVSAVDFVKDWGKFSMARVIQNRRPEEAGALVKAVFEKQVGDKLRSGLEVLKIMLFSMGIKIVMMRKVLVFIWEREMLKKQQRSDFGSKNLDLHIELVDSCRAGNAEKVKSLINADTKLDAYDEINLWVSASPFEAAVDGKNPAVVVEALVTHGLKLTPKHLGYAVRKGSTEIVRWIIEGKHILDLSGIWSYNQGIVTADVLEVLLSHRLDLNKPNKHGETALSSASNWGSVESVKMLLDHKADVDAGLPLIKALSYCEEDYLTKSEYFDKDCVQHLQIASVLVENGADVFLSRFGRTAFQVALDLLGKNFSGRVNELVEAMIAKAIFAPKLKAEKGLLEKRLAGSGDSRVAIPLKKIHGILSEKLTSLVQSPVKDLRLKLYPSDLYDAAREGDVEMVDWILKLQGVDGGTSRLEGLKEGKDIEAVFIELGAGLKFFGGETLLSYESKNGRVENVKTLLGNGADVNSGYPLHSALSSENIEIAQILIDRGANVQLERNGETALQASISLLCKKPGDLVRWDILEKIIDRVSSSSTDLDAAKLTLGKHLDGNPELLAELNGILKQPTKTNLTVAVKLLSEIISILQSARQESELMSSAALEADRGKNDAAVSPPPSSDVATNKEGDTSAVGFIAEFAGNLVANLRGAADHVDSAMRAGLGVLAIGGGNGGNAGLVRYR